MDHNTLVDIFFTITGIAAVIITILLVIGIIYLISIFRIVRRIVRTAEFAGEMIKDDLMELRQNVKEKGLTFSAFAKFFTNMGKRRLAARKKNH